MHKKLLTTFSFLLFALFFASIVNAQTATGTTSAERLKMQLQEIQAQKKAAVSDIKMDAKETTVELREKMKAAIAAKRAAVKEAVATRREEFKAKLQTIRDEKKKAIVERIDAKLATVNAKHTDRFTQVLSNLQIVLDKIAEDIDKTEAQAAIDAAKLAVENQAAKTYIITISTDSALRSDVGTVTSQLRQDLTGTHKAVIAAKKAVQTLRGDSVMIKKETTNLTN